MNLKELKAVLRRRFNIPKERPVRRTLLSFTFAERTLFYFFAVIFILAGTSLLWQVSAAYLSEVPIKGGTLVEGVVGNPRFINPVLALSEADKNLTALVYSGLVRVTPEGKVVGDLADKVEISEDNLTYTLTISEQARFHDGIPVTADDVLFTIQKVLDPMIKSPRRGNWEGVTIEKVDERTVAFSLKKPYAPFVYNLTLGILPRYIWKNVTADEFSFSQFNALPVGAGPYKIESVARNDGGIPDYYELAPFEHAIGKTPYIGNLIFRFFSSEEELVEAYNEGSVESIAGISPEKISGLNAKSSQVIHSPLPRVFAVFFNQSQSKVLLDKAVREALNLAAPKSEIVSEVLNGYGVAIENPVPFLKSESQVRDSASSTPERISYAEELLADAGWKMNEETGVLEKKLSNGTMPLSFSISTGDAEELRLVAEELTEAWSQLGAKVEILVYETGELNQSVIRPRNFDALLFGEVIGREGDLYPFWHSSQRNDPGLNIALYANSKADKFLEEARSVSDPEAAKESYLSFAEELEKDLPAIFLYSPSFLYVVPEKVKAVALNSLSVSQDRFLGIRDWYIETDRVWKIFLD